ncbi:MAG: hypothetical protein ACRD2A_24320 [Vicinamibacterales bacterium]
MTFVHGISRQHRSRLRGGVDGRLANDLDGLDDRQEKHGISVQVGPGSAGGKRESGLSGIHHVSQANDVLLRRHT